MRRWNQYGGYNYSNALAHITKYKPNQRSIGIQNNTTLVRGFDDEYMAVKLWGTEVVRYFPDGTVKLYANGWPTLTTRNRITGYTNAHFASNKHGRWYLYTKSGVVTPPKIQKCRTCFGRHELADDDINGKALAALRGAHNWSDCPEVEKWRCTTAEMHMYRCYRCQNTGKVDYGSKAETVEFYDGITIDTEGMVIA